MNQSDFLAWTIAYRKTSGLGINESEFIDGWYPSMGSVEKMDADAALKTLPSDSRLAKTLPRDRLDLVLEHIGDARSIRVRRNRVDDCAGERPAWTKEFSERMKKAAKQTNGVKK